MASSGYKSVTVTEWDTLRFSWSVASQSVANNASTVNWQMDLIATTYGRINAGGESNWSITVNGTNYTGKKNIGIGNNETKTLASGSTTIAHNADGSKSFNFSFSQVFNITFSDNYIGTISGSGSGTLDTIPRAATLTSAPNFSDEANPTINYSNAAGNGVSSLQACIANDSGTTTYAAYRDISKTGTSYTFNLTSNERAALQSAAKNSNSITVRFYVKTVIGSNTYYSSLAKTLTIVNAAPTLNPTAIDVAGNSTSLTGDANKVIKGYNYMQVAANAAALKQATISSYKISCGAKSITTASGRLDFVESGTFTFTVTDSRGNTTTKTLNKTLINYVKLTCNLDAEAPSTDGVMSFTVSGNYFNGSFGAVSNSLTVQYRIKTESGSYSGWQALTATISGNTYKAEKTISGLDYQSNYTIQARAIDKVYGATGGDPAVTTPEKRVKTTPIFDWGENDFSFNVPVKYMGDKKLFYTAGDTITIADAAACFAGFVTNGQLDIFLTIPLNKPVFANNFTISGNVLCRGVDGYIKGNSYSSDSAVNLQGGSGYAINNKLLTESGLLMLIRFNSAIPYTVNNTPITATPYGTLTITFT